MYGFESLCSGFSHIVATIGDVYVWLGMGAVDSEQKAGKEYATKLAVC